MRLEKIKLSGFKSFVDPTTISFPSNLIGIVGPNGCGKSNIIDAVRWVMGELSAKQLRGDSITDVIFNGSRDRKPISQASIELIFDNSEGKLGGEYAKYSQIALRREVSREAQSTYYLNGTKCRRRDITDVFLGTGLGPRSYAIIEQDMISRFIEAKPDELRSYLEEVAGISKYKERRKETESRIHRTRENLNRIHDIREELETQINKLKRQARAAERYKILKEEERQLKAQQLALRWRSLDTEINQFNAVISERQTVLESHKAKLQHIDTDIEKAQTIKTDLNDNFQEIQTRYYTLGSEIVRIEQAIEHRKELQEQLEIDLEQTEMTYKEAKESLQQDETKLQEIQQALETLTPEVEQKRQTVEDSQVQLHAAEEDIHAWQQEWETFNEEAAQTSKTAEVQQARIQHLEQQQAQANQRLVKLDQEKAHVSGDAHLQMDLEKLIQNVDQARHVTDEKRQQLTDIIRRIDEQRATNQEISDQLDQHKKELQNKRETGISLEALQQAALGQKDDHVVKWLAHHRLDKQSRLAQALQVEKGWEKAAEVVLGSYLEAICVDGVDDEIAKILETLEQGTVTLFDTQAQIKLEPGNQRAATLSSKVQSHYAIASLLQGVYVVDTLPEALALRDLLSASESIVTKSGLWLSRTWMRVARGENSTTGVIEREQQLRDIKSTIEIQEKYIAEAESALKTNQETFNQLKQQRAELKDALAKSETAYAESNAKLQVIQSQADQIRRHHERLTEDFEEQHRQIDVSKQQLEEAQKLWQEATHKMESNTDWREVMLQKRDHYRDRLEQTKQKVQEDQTELHHLEMQFETNQTQLSALQESVSRVRKQLALLRERRERLSQDLTKDDTPTEQLQQDLESALEKRVIVESELTEAKQKVDDLEHEIQTGLKRRHGVEQDVNDARTALEEKRLEGQAFRTRQTTLQEQLAESAFNLNQLLSELTEEATEALWNEKLEHSARRISRLGPINLAAIEEYEQSSERKTYLDAQYADLEEALKTLQNAIRRIDRETRTRFKETFDKVNTTFQELFPKIFGGGGAYLELTGEDLLDTGVTLMARPPGKRIANIHLLSGGEKALTAIALVFSLFQLNPAPFCLLDEVDAPLDDYNVSRFCELVKEMSQKIQFVFISHNKNAVEMAKHLMGVTMHEPGVSRVVSVDVEAAVSMVED